MNTFIKLTNKDGVRITVKTSEIVMYHPLIRTYHIKWWWGKKRIAHYKAKYKNVNTFMWLSHRIYLKVQEEVCDIESMLGLTNTK